MHSTGAEEWVFGCSTCLSVCLSLSLSLSLCLSLYLCILSLTLSPSLTHSLYLRLPSFSLSLSLTLSHSLSLSLSQSETYISLSPTLYLRLISLTHSFSLSLSLSIYLSIYLRLTCLSLSFSLSLSLSLSLLSLSLSLSLLLSDGWIQRNILGVGFSRGSIATFGVCWWCWGSVIKVGVSSYRKVVCNIYHQSFISFTKSYLSWLIWHLNWFGFQIGYLFGNTHLFKFPAHQPYTISDLLNTTFRQLYLCLPRVFFRYGFQHLRKAEMKLSKRHN